MSFCQFSFLHVLFNSVTLPCEEQLDRTSFHTHPLLKRNSLHSARDFKVNCEFPNGSKTIHLPQDTCTFCKPSLEE